MNAAGRERSNSHRGVFGVALATLLFLHAPIVVLMVYSFNDSRYGVEWTGFTLRWYERLAERGDLRDALVRSLVIATTSALLATVLGTLLAVAMARLRRRGLAFVEALVALPLITPEIVIGISFLGFCAIFGLPLGISSIVVAHTAFAISFVVIVVRARLEGMGQDLEEAAMALGADEASAFLRVTLPSLRPAVIAGALLAFTLSLDDFLITFFVAGPGSSTLPLVVYPMVRKGVEPSVNAISTILVIVTTLAVAIAERRTRSSATRT